MASIFTYQEEPPRVHSPWSTPGNVTPQGSRSASQAHPASNGQVTPITKLEPERQDGPTEYKLHLLLRPRRYYLVNSYQPSVVSATQNDTSSRSLSDAAVTRISGQHLANSRQARLQQLTTQLLWRLQQSSPFHSSSNADLVLPVLPEATPRLGIPDRPAKLLPGLEESQGALYEIGVADDGTLVGLIEEELEESLNNLRAMAASLGCVVDILRRVLIPQQETSEQSNQNDGKTPAKVWVAEVLVRPETKSPRVPSLEQISATQTLSDLCDIDADADAHKKLKPQAEQLRVAVTGATVAGKSSLVGTLTTSTLDNGRGKSRLSLLKHRHEIASGVTSSVAQELLGYRDNPVVLNPVVNYSTGDVSSWPDIHNLASRLVFLSDSPGLPRYAKSTFRTLVSWKPNWTLLCVAADEGDITTDAGAHSLQLTREEALMRGLGSQDTVDLSMAHLDMCLKLELPLVVVVTKMDVATKTGLKTVLSKILSALKTAEKVPVLLGSPSNTISIQDDNVDIPSELAHTNEKEKNEIIAVVERVYKESARRIVPIVLTSAVTGAGFGKLHALLKDLPTSAAGTVETLHLTQSYKNESMFHVDEIFAIPPSKVYSENREDHSADHGIVLCGHLAAGKLNVGDQLRLGPFALDSESNTGDDSSHTPRSASYCIDNGRRPMPRALSGILSKSLQIEQQKSPSTPVDAGSTFLDVCVVSLRSLRLPGRSMQTGETGTVGVQPISYPSLVPLSRARKGMVLTSAQSDSLYGYRSFAALFPASDFTNTTSPTLILGGHAIVYVNSIRAAVRVTALAFEDDSAHTEPSSPTELFSFDGDDRDTSDNGSVMQEHEARITFRFVSSMEWMEPGSRVLVIPTVMAAGPVTGPQVMFNGLSGFVGRICDVFT